MGKERRLAMLEEKLQAAPVAQARRSKTKSTKKEARFQTFRKSVEQAKDKDKIKIKDDHETESERESGSVADETLKAFVDEYVMKHPEEKVDAFINGTVILEFPSITTEQIELAKQWFVEVQQFIDVQQEIYKFV